MLDPAALLAAYDDQLRAEAEFRPGEEHERHGPLVWGRFPGGQGFVTYRDLGGLTGTAVRDLVATTLAHYRDDPSIDVVEWKTRGHDDVPGLDEALIEHGFLPEETETVMVGHTVDLVSDAAPPDGVTVRRIDQPDDVVRMVAMADEAFGTQHPWMTGWLLERLASPDDHLELWVAEAEGQVVSCGRLEPVPGADFAGLWGGATLAAWRSRGIYRALTSERARSALHRGRTLVHSDCTEHSRPILERAGLVAVTTTTPYEWTREA